MVLPDHPPRPPAAWRRLYLMVKPPPAVAATIHRLRLRLGFGIGYWTGRLHVTLLPFGAIDDRPPDFLARLRVALDGMTFEPFDLRFDRVSGQALTGAGMRAASVVQQDISRRLVASGLPPRPYQFRPHLSLAYGKGLFGSVPVAPIAWTVTEPLLVGSGCGEHVLLGCWPLTQRQHALAL